MNVDVQYVSRENRAKLLANLAFESPEEYKIVEQYMTKSDYIIAGSVDGNLCCVLGAISETLISEKAYIWFLHTAEFDRYKFVFARRSRDIIQTLRSHHSIFVGHCLRDSKVARRWVKWLGARFTGETGELVSFEIGAA
jgi:hypothetical protein